MSFVWLSAITPFLSLALVIMLIVGVNRFLRNIEQNFKNSNQRLQRMEEKLDYLAQIQNQNQHQNRKTPEHTDSSVADRRHEDH